ncbi:MAG: hypothetical protein RH949_32170 [Coleofasciculus sp. A1-SPW-01]
MILDCEIYDRQRLQPEDTLPVEVLRHIKDSSELITVVPVGKRRKYLDLPTWMTKKLPDPGLRRSSISQYIYWRNSEQSNAKNLKIIDDSSEQLDRLLCHWFNDAYGAYGQKARNLEPEAQLKVAKKWEKQNRYKPEINAAFVIMAILLLSKYEETKHQAYKLTQNLGRRALRSLHIEVLYQRWLSLKDNRERTDGLWRRLRQLENEQHFYIPLKENSSDAIRQFCNAVEMRSDRELLPIADSFSAALGELFSSLELDTHAFITKKLIILYLTLHPRSRMKNLQNYHTNELQEILKIIDQNKFDILLLEPLNYKADNYSKDLGEIDLLSELFPQDQGDIDIKSWFWQQIEHLDDLTEKSIRLQEDINNLKSRFQRLNKITIIEE